MKQVLIVAAVALLAVPAAAQDAIDLREAQVMRSAPDVASWPVTTAITRLELGATDCAVDFSLKEVWPNVPIAGWNGGSIAYTLWMVRNVGGQWYTGGGIEFWNGTSGTPTRVGGCGPAAGYVHNWYYDDSWGPLNTAGELTPGERVGFFVTAGDARAKDVRTVTARSAVVAVPWPGGTGGSFLFEPPAPAPEPPPPPAHPPPVFVPPPIVTPAPPIVTPPLDLDAAIRRVLNEELLPLARDTNQKTTEIHAEVKSFAQQIGDLFKWVGKTSPYWGPALGTLIAAAKMNQPPAAATK